MPNIVLYDKEGQPINIDNAETITTDLEDGGKTKFTHGVLMQNPEISLDFSTGENQTISVPDGYLVRGATLLKPEALKPENIVKNVVVAGVVGSYEVNEINLDSLTELIPVTEFTVQADSGGMVPIPMPIGLEAGSIYLVLWNSVGYICKAQAVEYSGLPVVAVGNSVAWGGEDTGEPFAIGEFPAEVAEQNGGLYGGIIPVDGSTSFKAGGYFVGDSGTILEDLPVVLDFSNGNQKITADDGYLVKSAIIEKPSTLVPENIVKDVDIAGVVGTHEGGGGNDEIIGGLIENKPVGLYQNAKVTTIRSTCFMYSPIGTEYYFPNCVTIQQSAFVSAKITSAIFDSCESIYYAAFLWCTVLQYTSFPVCKTISGAAFQYCYSLANVNFPECITISNSAFAYCSSLTKAYFPKCQNLAPSAFRSCSSLSYALFGALKSFGSSALYSLSRLMSLYILGSTVPSASGWLFGGTPMAASTYTGSFGSIFVRASLVEAFKSASAWSTFSNRYVGMTDEEIAALGVTL